MGLSTLLSMANSRTLHPHLEYWEYRYMPPLWPPLSCSVLRNPKLTSRNLKVSAESAPFLLAKITRKSGNHKKHNVSYLVFPRAVQKKKTFGKLLTQITNLLNIVCSILRVLYFLPAIRKLCK